PQRRRPRRRGVRRRGRAPGRQLPTGLQPPHPHRRRVRPARRRCPRHHHRRSTGMTDTYDPDVRPGGPWSMRELGALTIRKMSVSEMHNNVYLLTCRATREQLLVDAADEPERIRELVAAGGSGLDHLVTTHQHWDHVRALVEICRDYSPETYAGEDDAPALPQRPDHRLRHLDTVTFGEISLGVVHLRGHTPGSVALAYDDPEGHVHLFTGDSLFPGGVGATHNPG